MQKSCSAVFLKAKMHVFYTYWSAFNIMCMFLLFCFVFLFKLEYLPFNLKYFSVQNVTQCQTDSCFFIRMINKCSIHPAPPSPLFFSRNWHIEPYCPLSWAKVSCYSSAVSSLFHYIKNERLEEVWKKNKIIFCFFSSGVVWCESYNDRVPWNLVS